MDNAQTFSLKAASHILARICMTRLPLKGDLLIWLMTLLMNVTKRGVT